MWLIFLVSLVHGDVYMHAPRGANDRNCERNVNRNNGNLLYDTQNNAKGGYACPRAVANSNDQIPENGLTPRMKYEEGSKLEVEWTAQHGCGLQKESAGSAEKTRLMAENANVHCEIVIQMACSGTLDPMMEYSGNTPSQPTNNVATFNTASTPNGLIAVPREGIPQSDGDAATDRIGTSDPGTAKLVKGQNEQATLRSGVHETPEYYNACNRVQRNRGLFTADQNVNRRSAIGTRQNPNGGRRGLECPEERDYYPYWGPSPFLDIAYLVDDSLRCGDTTSTLPCGGQTGRSCTASVGINEGDWVGNAQGFTQGNLKNVNGACVDTSTGKIPKNSNGLTGNARRLYNRREWPNNELACNDLKTIQANQNTKLEWKRYMFTPMIDGASTNAAAFVTAASKGPECNTLDYSRSNHLGNTGSGDTASRYTMTIPKVNPQGASITTAALENQNKANCVNCRTPEGEPCLLRIRYNMSSSDYNRSLDSASNGEQSPIEQDPLVEVGVTGGKQPVQLALNTNQVARTFQDRSYVFYVVPRANGRPATQEVINVAVRGKRGNIVQTYPAVEYDFIPNNIMINQPDNQVLAFQWIGSDYNPRRGCNDGEGGPYTGDNNVIERLKANPNLQGSNQNSRNDRTTLLAQNPGSKKNYPFIDSNNQAQLYAGNKGLPVNEAQAARFMDAKAKEQLKPLNLNCLTATEINNINNENRRENHPRNCAEGNALSPYFSTEFVDFATAARQAPAEYVMYSARNNNFSNRDTKFKVFVQPASIPSLPQEFFAEPEQLRNGMFNQGLVYDANIGSYDTEAMVEAKLETDVIGFDPVENNAFGEGALEGCEQEMLTFSAASSKYSHFELLVFLFFSAVYALFN